MQAVVRVVGRVWHVLRRDLHFLLVQPLQQECSPRGSVLEC